MISRLPSAAEQLAADPEVQAALANIPRTNTPARPPKAKSLFPAATEAELAQGLRSEDDPEISIRGLIARVKLLESHVSKLRNEVAALRLAHAGRKGSK